MGEPQTEIETLAKENAVRALKLVAASLPHLSGLCHTVRIQVNKKYPVAAIGASGLLLVNPHIFTESPLQDLVFVMAHELMHLALDSFGRTGNASPRLVNIAHDYVINDILATELNRPVPFGGLVRHGARQESLESLVTELARNGSTGEDSWSVERRKPKRGGKSKIREQLERAGLLPPEPEDAEEEADDPHGDTLTSEEEAELEPTLGPKERTATRERIRREAVRSMSLKELREQMEAANKSGGRGDVGATRTTMDAITTAYQPPWQLALQHWLDAVSPGARSYAKASRRNSQTTDVILAGRKREGWTLHVVLDTSGSMLNTLPRILGLLASFCEGAGVNQIHLLQCDMGVTANDWIDPAELASYKLTGFGGSDMSPAMDELADDPEVHAVLVLTDGVIDYPREEPPYSVLWGLVDGDQHFRPLYGTVVHVRM
jgi:predicted metal-dependent peptidase